MKGKQNVPRGTINGTLLLFTIIYTFLENEPSSFGNWMTETQKILKRDMFVVFFD